MTVGSLESSLAYPTIFSPLIRSTLQKLHPTTGGRVSTTPEMSEPALAVFGPAAGLRTAVVIWIGVVVLGAIVASMVLTMGMSIWSFRRDRRRETIEAGLRPEFLERVEAETPEWAEWTDSMTGVEIDVLEDLVEGHLDLLTGRERESLLDLAEALEMESRARARLASGSHYERLDALDLLAKLGATPDPEWVFSHISDEQAEREAAVDLVSGEATDPERWIAMDVLLRDEPLTVFGVTALHDLVNRNPAVLLRYLDARTIEDPDVLAQTLLVLREAGIPTGDAPLDPIIDCLSHDSPAVRRRACGVLGRYGWRSPVRERVDVAALLDDESSSVRQAAYRMLDEWGDVEARFHLARALRTESDGRARLAIARGLYRSAPESIAELRGESLLAPQLQAWADARVGVETRPDPLL